METLNLFGFISRLIKVNNMTKIAKNSPLNNIETNTIKEDYLSQLNISKKQDGLPMTRRLALEQIKYLN